MKEVGIDISNHTSNLIDNTILNQSDLVVTLCSDADQNCPVLPPNVKKEHWGFDDPAANLGQNSGVLEMKSKRPLNHLMLDKL